MFDSRHGSDFYSHNECLNVKAFCEGEMAKLYSRLGKICFPAKKAIFLVKCRHSAMKILARPFLPFPHPPYGYFLFSRLKTANSKK